MIAAAFQGPADEIEDIVFIIDDEDFAAGALKKWSGRRGGFVEGGLGLWGNGEMDDEGGALAGFAFGGDGAAMFLDDAVGEAQAQAGAFADGFGGEEGVEDFGQVFRRNAWAVVLKTNLDFLSQHASAEANDAMGTEGFNGLAGIIDNVEEDLLELMRVHQQAGQRGGEVFDDVNVVGAKLVNKNFNDGVDD